MSLAVNLYFGISSQARLLCVSHKTRSRRLNRAEVRTLVVSRSPELVPLLILVPFAFGMETQFVGAVFAGVAEPCAVCSMAWLASLYGVYLSYLYLMVKMAEVRETLLHERCVRIMLTVAVGLPR